MAKMMKKKKAWPFMPISDQSERFRARRPERPPRSQPSTFFIMMMMQTMMMIRRRRRRFMMMIRRLKMMMRFLGDGPHVKEFTQ